MTTNGATPTNSFASQASSRTGLLRRCGEAVVALLFPPHCIACGGIPQRLEVLCNRCAAELPTIERPYCLRCQAPLDDPRHDLCSPCAGRAWGFDVARSLGPYASLWGALVRTLKFEREKAVARWLSGRLARSLRSQDPFGRIDVITYVPMTRSARRARGFNQAAWLAKATGKRLGIPVRRLLAKVRETPPQMRLPAKQRRRNLHGAFRVVSFVVGRVLLVDDILTTASTVEECAHALRSGGAEAVVVLTVARA